MVLPRVILSLTENFQRCVLARVFFPPSDGHWFPELDVRLDFHGQMTGFV